MDSPDVIYLHEGKYILVTPTRESSERLLEVLKNLLKAAENDYYTRVRGTSLYNIELQSAIHDAQEVVDDLP